MRTCLLLATALALATPAVARADGGPFGLGISLGQPTGLTLGYRFSPKSMLDVTLGLDGFDNDAYYVHAVVDFFPFGDILGGGSVGLSPYIGIGGIAFDAGDIGLAARVPFGLSLDFRRAPIQIFGEIALILVVTPDTDTGFDGAGGFRYFF